MKLSSVLLLPFLARLTIANPIAAANPVDLETRADTWCSLHPTVDKHVHCRAGAGSRYEHVRWIRADDPGLPQTRFGVSCKAYGEVIYGNRVWDKIPGWNCWVSAHYTNSGCETNLKWC